MIKDLLSYIQSPDNCNQDDKNLNIMIDKNRNNYFLNIK
jgi:hypothetical protein